MLRLVTRPKPRRLATGQPNEHQLQTMIVNWAAWYPLPPDTGLGDLNVGDMMYAIPNGGYRTKVGAAQLKAEGVKPGIPDLHLPIARRGFHSLYMELKARTVADEKEQQRDARKNLAKAGNFCCVVADFDVAISVLRWYLGIAEELPQTSKLFTYSLSGGKDAKTNR